LSLEHKLKKEKQKRQKKQYIFSNILLLQSRSPERGLQFPSFVSFSFSQKYVLLFKFETTFEAIKKKTTKITKKL